MLLNSYTFIFLFLPITLAVYFTLHRRSLSLLAKLWLVFMSLFFYGYWDPVYIPLLIGSILFNYAIGFLLNRTIRTMPSSKRLLVLGIAGNLSLLAYFKYMDFFIVNINTISSLDLPLFHLTLPLGISFFTFTQIAYLIDIYRGTIRERTFLNYILLVTFFPRLAAGPIVRYQEMMPQFEDLRNKIVNHQNIAEGLVLFSLGLFKKVVIADTLADLVNNGFDLAPTLGLIEAWITSLSYTLQIYYDFSGYTDMALGVALLFNIRLPINFDSPYQAHNIQEFWRRWHMSLSRFVRDYIYIPLKGSKGSEIQTVMNILFTFFLVGLWHGAGWMFVTWGLLHGVALVVFHFWQKTSLRLPKFIAWLITFNFVNIAWIFFRAKTFSGASKVLKGMMGLTGIILPETWIGLLTDLKKYGIQFGNVIPTLQWDIHIFFWLFISFFLAISFRNSNELARRFKPSWKTVMIFSPILLYAISHLQKTSDFIYFNF